MYQRKNSGVSLSEAYAFRGVVQLQRMLGDLREHCLTIAVDELPAQERERLDGRPIVKGRGRAREHLAQRGPSEEPGEQHLDPPVCECPDPARSAGLSTEVLRGLPGPALRR